MRRPTKQDLLGNWSGATWLYALAWSAAVALFLTLLVEAMPK